MSVESCDVKRAYWQRGAVKGMKHYPLVLDITMLVCTCGLWAIWMCARPIYIYEK